MHTVLLVGNGFDLSLGFKTSYQDFIESSYFRNLKGHLPDFLKERLVKKNHRKWIDIEMELGIYAANVSTSIHFKTFKNEFSELSSALKEYIKNLDLTKLNEESAANILISKLAGVPLTKVEIFNFNYTRLFPFVLKPFIHFNPIVFNIHGHYDSDIIFGIQDEALSYSNLELLKSSFIIKSLQRGYSPRNILKSLSECKVLIIFGHSLGETDHSYFTDFFARMQADKGIKVKFFYFGEEGFDNLNQQLFKLTKGQTAKFKGINDVELYDSSNLEGVKKFSI